MITPEHKAMIEASKGPSMGEALFDTRTALYAAQATIKELKELNSILHVNIANLNQRVEKLQRFKDTTHNMLNVMQIPQYEQHECRVTKRLEHVAKRLKECILD